MPAVAVAYSGGRDSAALLHATAAAAAELPGLQVVALHVHHGLNDQADAWLAHAQATCQALAARGWPVRLLSRRVSVPDAAGLSLEAEARRLRHAALADMAREAGADLLLLAHHRRDQAETFLLQALRGGGVAGLAAMPKDDWRDGVRWVRPWLNLPREAIEVYVAQHGLGFVEDDSNGDRRFARNRLRLDVWPALVAAFPGAEVALARSASRAADALPVLRAWQAQALDCCAGGDAGSDETGDEAGDEPGGARATLDALTWSKRPEGERRQVLLRWLARHGLGGASWVERLSREVPKALAGQGSARWPELGVFLYRGRLRCAARTALSGALPGPEVILSIAGPGDWPVPGWPGRLRVKLVEQGGLSPASVQGGLRVRPRVGGERFQMGLQRPARDLKRQFQALGVPAWARSVPLFFVGADLVFVPGLGVNAPFLAPAGALQWDLSWLPDVAQVPGGIVSR